MVDNEMARTQNDIFKEQLKRYPSSLYEGIMGFLNTNVDSAVIVLYMQQIKIPMMTINMAV